MTMTISQVVVVGTPPERKQNFLFLLVLSLLVHSFLSFFVHSYNRTKREMFRISWTSLYKIFLNNTFGNERINVFEEIEWVRLICSIVTYIQVCVEHSYANLFEEKLFCVRWLCPADHRYSGSSTSINLFAKVG